MPSTNASTIQQTSEQADLVHVPFFSKDEEFYTPAHWSELTKGARLLLVMAKGERLYATVDLLSEDGQLLWVLPINGQARRLVLHEDAAQTSIDIRDLPRRRKKAS